MKVTIAALDKQGNNVAEKMLKVLKEFSVEKPSHFGFVAPRKRVLDKNLDLLIRQSPQSSTAVGIASSKPASQRLRVFAAG